MAGPGWAPPRLDGFVLTERLGSGTYATVYKAYAKVGAGRALPSEPRRAPRRAAGRKRVGSLRRPRPSFTFRGRGRGGG